MERRKIKLALIGATGLVGRTMIQVLEEENVTIDEFFPISSPRSRGSEIEFQGEKWRISSLEDELWRQANVALLSAGGIISGQWIPKLVENQITCIDNSSAFRQDPSIPLIVPEVNSDVINQNHRIIANPNCSTIQLTVVLKPLHDVYQLKEVVVATYQSVSGAGEKGRSRLVEQQGGDIFNLSPFPHPIHDNLIPGVGALGEDNLFTEEWKLVWESRKILNLPDLKVFPTAVRVPVPICHSEAVHLKFKKRVDPKEAREILTRFKGIIVHDNPEKDIYPMPTTGKGRNEVFVGRIRQIKGEDTTLDLWIVSDNLRKGAATNAVQILKALIAKGFIR